MTKRKNSETVTENLFRKFYGTDNFTEKSAIPSKYGFVSKKNTQEIGYPDFFKHEKSKGFDFYIIVEAKSINHKNACDDLLHYMNNNKINGDIIGIAISGQSNEKLKVTYYFKNTNTPNSIKIIEPKVLLPLDKIIKIFKKEKYGDSITDDDLNNILKKLNEQLHKGNRVRDTDRSLFFSGIMIALTDKDFRKNYKNTQAPSKDDLGKKCYGGGESIRTIL